MEDTVAVGGPLTVALREIESHVAAAGWDQPPRLFALARTAELAVLEPGLALGTTDPDAVTAIEQDPLPSDTSLEVSLEQLGWPDEVVGVALVVERLYLPPTAEDDLPLNEQELAAAAARHPDRRDVRICVAVLRDGSRHCALRFRDADDRLSEGPNLVPGLADALLATLTV